MAVQLPLYVHVQGEISKTILSSLTKEELDTCLEMKSPEEIKMYGKSAFLVPIHLYTRIFGELNTGSCYGQDEDSFY